MRDLDRAITDRETGGFVKVLTARGKDRILGVTIVGANGAEIPSEYVLAMRHGIGLSKVLRTIHAHPTFSEANKYAAGEWRRARQPDRLMRWLSAYQSWKHSGLLREGSLGRRRPQRPSRKARAQEPVLG